MKNLVSVIIPNYNSEKYIHDTIQSVLNQTYKNIEILIIDDCSSDNSVSIIKNMASENKNIKLIQLTKNCGRPAKPRNIGISKSKGEYIAFLDSDDIWHRQKIEFQLYCMKKYNNSFSSCAVQIFNKNIPEELEFIPSHFDKKRYISFKNINNLLIKNFIKSGSSVLCKKSIIKNIMFNELAEYKAVEDYNFWLDIHKKNNFSSIFINEKLVFYRVSDSSISKDKFLQAKKVFNLLSKFENNGKKLGFKKFFFFFTYAFFSIVSVFKDNQ